MSDIELRQVVLGKYLLKHSTRMTSWFVGKSLIASRRRLASSYHKGKVRLKERRRLTQSRMWESKSKLCNSSWTQFRRTSWPSLRRRNCISKVSPPISPTDFYSTLFANAVTQETTGRQTWMNLLKMLLVLSVCGVQVYLTTSYFSKGSSKGGKPNINPFGSQTIWKRSFVSNCPENSLPLY